MNTHQNAERWRPALIALILVLAWTAYWYAGTLGAMVEIWSRSDTYAHGFIVPPIVLWLIWRERQQIARYQPVPSFWMLLPLTVLVFGWLIGELTAVNALTQFTATAILISAGLALLGPRLGVRLAFPLAFLFFAVPIGDFMMPQLMAWTAKFTVLALRLSNVPVYQEGLQFVIPSGHWSVVEACSGIRYIIASLTVGTLFAYLNYASLKRRLTFIAVSLLVPILANWMRAYIIVMLGHLSSNRLATGADHLIYGWVFFGIVILIMFAIGMRWSEEPVEKAPSPAQAAADSAHAHSPWPVALAVAAICAAGPIIFAQLSKAPVRPPLSLPSPTAPSGWQVTTPLTDWHPAFANPSAELRTAFAKGTQTVGLYIAYYRDQNFERKLVTSTNLLARYKDPVWSVTSEGHAEIDIGSRKLDIRTADLLGKGSTDIRLETWQWYWINGRLTSSDAEAKLYTALARLIGRGDDSAVIILYAPKQIGQPTTVLNQFAAVDTENILKMLHSTRDQK